MSPHALALGPNCFPTNKMALMSDSYMLICIIKTHKMIRVKSLFQHIINSTTVPILSGVNLVPCQKLKNFNCEHFGFYKVAPSDGVLTSLIWRILRCQASDNPDSMPLLYFCLSGPLGNKCSAVGFSRLRIENVAYWITKYPSYTFL